MNRFRLAPLAEPPFNATAPAELCRLRLPAAMLAAVLAIAMASGCGGDPPPPRLAHTSIARSHAPSVARAIALRAGDLPEFKATAHAAVAWARADIVDDLHCERGSRSALRKAWASARSDRLAVGSGYHALGASSSTLIMPTVATARRSIARGSVHMEEACLKRAVRRAAARSFHLHGIVVKPLPVTVAGAGANVAYQTIIGVHGAPLVIYVDSIVFAYGQDVVGLTDYHYSRPVPAAMEERLLGLLVARARAHAR